MLGSPNTWTAPNTFAAGLSAGGNTVTNVGNPAANGDAANKAYVDSNTIRFVPGAVELSVGDANGTAPMISLRGGSTCCSGPGGHTPAFFKVFQNGSFLATGNLGIGVSPLRAPATARRGIRTKEPSAQAMPITNGMMLTSAFSRGRAAATRRRAGCTHWPSVTPTLPRAHRASCSAAATR